ncbi:MAG: urea ABC transporter ATP-binding subunit UrtE [Gammaproteobacteria bacterium]|jgi:urea transport system ATP-binding protein|uniref:ABC transporter domain-containing protein n=1 Tax=marine metagenome TaxID=408172 RepID=A0A381SY56_9ZZZZ|nr:urea ABC transporter ATP-binding subunit UrtE [Gammaproteobacteria bacterium]|tara:strand:+ start:3563 stop:4255 length:693 start_codon:yes stop_codon:yes gene_type:complete
MLTVKELNQFYGESHTLWDLDIKLNQGDCTCLMGRNGVGKTTLVKCIMGLLATTSGEIEFKGQSLRNLPAESRAPLGIAYVPQGREIFSQLTVEENLRIGLIVKKNKKDIPQYVFEIFPILKEMLQRRGGDLSGGQQQQLAIGRALVVEPSLLILDEPTEGIQPNIVREIGEIIQKLNKKKKITVLLIEQKLPFARRIADHFIILDKGHLVAKGEIKELNDELAQKYLAV